MISGIFPIVIIALIIYLVLRKRSSSSQNNKKPFYLLFSDNAEEDLSHWFLLLALPFLALTLVSLNEGLGKPLEIRVIVLFSSLVSVLCAYYFRSVLALLLGVIGAISWLMTNSIDWLGASEVAPATILGFMVFIFLFLYVLGQIHQKVNVKYSEFSKAYLLMGIVPILILLFLLSSETGRYLFSELFDGEIMLKSWQLTTSFIFTLVILVTSLIYALFKKAITLPELIDIFAILVIFGLIGIFGAVTPIGKLGYFSGYGEMALISGGNSNLSLANFLMIAFNFVLFFKILGMIITGYVRKESWFVNLGAVMLFIFIIVKYFDWFFSFLDKSIFFVGAGLLLFGLGWSMEKGRRIVVKNIKSEISKSYE